VVIRRYPFNNFLHHHVENIIVSCLESNRSLLIDHVLIDCKLVDKILNSQENLTLSTDPSKVVHHVLDLHANALIYFSVISRC
jgi:SIT4 phosphatase-associated protein